MTQNISLSAGTCAFVSCRPGGKLSRQCQDFVECFTRVTSREWLKRSPERCHAALHVYTTLGIVSRRKSHEFACVLACAESTPTTCSSPRANIAKRTVATRRMRIPTELSCVEITHENIYPNVFPHNVFADRTFANRHHTSSDNQWGSMFACKSYTLESSRV